MEDIIDNLSADTLEVNDQILIGEDLFIIKFIDSDRPNIDEILVKGENLSGGESEFVLFADDYYKVWSV